MKMRTDWWLCEVCGKSRGRGRDHSKCSKLLQDKHKADMAQPVGEGGLARITEQHRRNAQYKKAVKGYKSGKGRWVS